MQDRYAGDVGDFGKFALLRALGKGRRLAVCWYRCAGEGERSNDGRHVAYLKERHLRALDDVAFDAMARIIDGPERSLQALEALKPLPGAMYHGETVPRRETERDAWSRAMIESVEPCHLVFTDADNGFEWGKLSPNCVARDEVRKLRQPGRALLLYHHQTRRKGGAAADFDRFAEWLFDVGAKSVEAVRLRPYSSRFYLLVDADEPLSAALSDVAKSWGEHAEHFPRVPSA